MLAERSLQRQHADLHAWGPRDHRDSPAAVGELDVEGVDLLAAHRLAEARDTLATIVASAKCVVASTMALAMVGGSALLKMPLPTNTACAPSCITSAASAGVAMPPAQNSGTGSSPRSATSCTSSTGARSSLAQP